MIQIIKFLQKRENNFTKMRIYQRSLPKQETVFDFSIKNSEEGVMVYTYEEYLEKPKSITMENCLDIHHRMIEEIGDDEDAIELYDELLEKAVKYAKIRAEWTFMDREWRIAEDVGRSRLHDSLIVKFNQLAKYLKQKGKEVSWRDELGYPETNEYYRKVIGDMACFIVYVHGINGR